MGVEVTWQHIRLTFEHNEGVLFILGTTMVFTCVFWLSAGLFLVIDLTGCPAWTRLYKVQPNGNAPVSLEQLKRVLRSVVFNQLVVGVPCVCLLYPAQVRMGMRVSADIPSASQILTQLVLFALVEEIGFYYSHRLLHLPVFYKAIHKQHHEWTAPIALVAVYAHPVEFLLSNILPLAAGPLLCGAHPVTSWLWYSIALAFTVIHHSGYHLPGLPSPEFHDYHHLKFNQNYGVLGTLDWLHGTDVNFRRSKQFERHKVIFSSLSMKRN